ncbi:MAG TPA: EfeM/EfeO family lipoprotein [Micromonosporaceae bacterium]
MRRVAFAGACVLVLATATACRAPHPPSELSVSRGACAPEWTTAGPGPASLTLHNIDIATAEVDLIDPTTGGVYAEVESLAPGTSRMMRVTLGKGAYALRCMLEGADAVTGATLRLDSGPPDADPAVAPVTFQDLQPVVANYQAYVERGLRTLGTDTAALRDALHVGDRARSRAAWLTAHLDYERLGAAYDAFGDVGDAIDGLPDGLPGGVSDHQFTGFHRIELGLWREESMSSLAALGDTLVEDVRRLRTDFPHTQIEPNDLPLRAHEILEDSLQFQLTGAADLGSGTSVATLEANLDGTRAVLDALEPVLRQRYAGWDSIGPAMSRVVEAVNAVRRPDGSLPALTSLTQTQRERLAGSLGNLIETLAPIAAIGEVRRTS